MSRPVCHASHTGSGVTDAYLTTHDLPGESFSALLVDATGSIAQSAPFSIQPGSESMPPTSRRGAIYDAHGRFPDDDCTLA